MADKEKMIEEKKVEFEKRIRSQMNEYIKESH